MANNGIRRRRWAGHIGGGINAGGYGNQNSFNSGFGGSGGCSANGNGRGAEAITRLRLMDTPTFGGYAAQTPAANATGLPVGSAAAAAAASAAAAAGTPRCIPPRIIANPLDNKLIIQADAQQYQNILKILKDLDVPPRQILLEAKIYSVTLSDAVDQQHYGELGQSAVSGGVRHLLGASTGAATGR